jgi:hypothetical protein
MHAFNILSFEQHWNCYLQLQKTDTLNTQTLRVEGVLICYVSINNLLISIMYTLFKISYCCKIKEKRFFI